jgi:transposase InsO family protein
VFTAVAPDVLWCGDVTKIDTGEGPLYLATTEDLFSRRMLGYAMSAHHDAALVVASLRMAAAVRAGEVDGVIFHSDRGSEYTAAATAAVVDPIPPVLPCTNALAERAKAMDRPGRRAGGDSGRCH